VRNNSPGFRNVLRQHGVPRHIFHLVFLVVRISESRNTVRNYGGVHITVPPNILLPGVVQRVVRNFRSRGPRRTLVHKERVGGQDHLGWRECLLFDRARNARMLRVGPDAPLNSTGDVDRLGRDLAGGEVVSEWIGI